MVGARSLLAVFLSIHVGVLDGPVRHAPGHPVLCLDGDGLGAGFPLVPWFWPLLLLQVVNGGALSFAWSGSQTLIAQLAEGRGRIYRPVQLLRAHRHDRGADASPALAWDFGGTWPSYMLGFAWGLVLTVALLRAPEAEMAPADAVGRGGARDFAPATSFPVCPIMCAASR